MRSSRVRNGILSLLLVFVGNVLEVADAFLHLAGRLVREAFRLLLTVAHQRSQLLARLAGEVLHGALGLVLVHERSPVTDEIVRWRPSRTRAYAATCGGPSGWPATCFARGSM